MKKTKEDLPVKINEKMRGGEGSVRVETMLTPEEMHNKGRLYARLTIMQGSSIGYHVHERETETFLVLSGSGEYSDNGVITDVCAGDVLYTPEGSGHSIKNKSGSEELVLIALILGA